MQSKTGLLLTGTVYCGGGGHPVGGSCHPWPSDPVLTAVFPHQPNLYPILGGTTSDILGRVRQKKCCVEGEYKGEGGRADVTGVESTKGQSRV